MKITTPLLTIALASASLATTADAATPVATYEFTNTLTADELGMPALLAIDPLAGNGFLVDTVFGESDTVYRFSGNATPGNEQAGLSLNTTSLLTPNSYSVELVFSFDDLNGYRRIIDVEDRQSDNGFYVLNNHLNIYPITGAGPNSFSLGYHHVILTVAPNGTVKGYIDGLADFTASTSVMNLSNSVNQTMSFFLDNVAAGGQGEYSSGTIAQLRVYDGVLTDAEALSLSQTPIVPEPATIALLAMAIPALAGRRRRR